MSMPYHPPQRTCTARILTPAGWVEGTIHLPIKAALLDHLEHTREFISMTEVRHAVSFEVVPFFALRRAAAMFVVPDEAEARGAADHHDARPTREHTLDCLLPGGHITGVIEVPMRMRVSDQLMHGAPLLVVKKAHARMRDPWRGEMVDLRADVMFVNTQHVVGVSEVEP